MVGTATSATIAKVTVERGRATTNFFGGNIRSAGTLTVDQSTITGGRASSGGGISNVGGTLNVLDSTVSGNSAPDGGGDSGAIQNFAPTGHPAPTLVVDRSTISGNTARNVGGILNWGDGASPGAITIRNSTIANNNSTVLGAGGLHIAANARATFQNSIIAGNLSVGSPSNCGADTGSSIVSNGHNLESNDECGFNATGDIVAADPLLGRLVDNGGGTNTHAPAPASPVKDTGTCPPPATTGAATLVQASSARLTGSVAPPLDQRGVVRPQDSRCDMGAVELQGAFVQPTSYRFDYGTTAAYGSQTPLTGLGAVLGAQGVSADVAGLAPGSSYHFRLVATNGTDTGLGLDQAFATQVLPPPPPPPPGPVKLADLPDPVQGVTTNVEPVGRGPVFVGIPAGLARAAGARASQKGVRFVPLREARQIPVGSFLDTRKGKVRLQSARNRRGARQQGDFASGLFQVLQSRNRSAKGLTELRLKGSSFGSCKPRARRATTRVQASASRRIRRLGANARGRFRTRGRHSAATVRGTKWTVTDRCDGTLTTVQRGSVTVRDFRRKKNITVKAGKSYLARARRSP